MNYKSLIHELTKFSKEHNINFYLIGGAVRDEIVGITNIKDIDISVEYEFENFVKLFSKRFNIAPKRISKFKTALFKLNEITIDIVTARKEIYNKHGALPEITESNIEDDIIRRDFTMNSIAYSFKEKKYIDLLNGIDDIKHKIIRGNKKGLFLEDPTRIFRLFKYKERFDFNIENSTLRDLNKTLKENELFINVSKSRIAREWDLIIKEEKRLEIIRDLKNYKIFEIFFNKNIRINFERDFTNLNKFETTLLMFFENETDVLIKILDVLLNGIKTKDIRNIKTIKNYIKQGTKIPNNIDKSEYLLKRILP